MVATTGSASPAPRTVITLSLRRSHSSPYSVTYASTSTTVPGSRRQERLASVQEKADKDGVQKDIYDALLGDATLNVDDGGCSIFYCLSYHMLLESDALCNLHV